MASQVKDQADAIVAAIGTVSGVPALIEWRKTDVLHPNRDDGAGGDPDEAVILTGGDRTLSGRAFEGSVGYDYVWQITVYRRETPDVTVVDDVETSLTERIIQKLATTTLSAAPSVWDFEVTPWGDWGIPSFREGVEVNRFGVLYRTWELQNG